MTQYENLAENFDNPMHPETLSILQEYGLYHGSLQYIDPEAPDQGYKWTNEEHQQWYNTLNNNWHNVDAIMEKLTDKYGTDKAEQIKQEELDDGACNCDFEDMPRNLAKELEKHLN